MDRIRIKKLKVYKKDGFTSDREASTEVFTVSLVLYLDFQRVTTSDKLDSLVDYEMLCTLLKDALLQTSQEGIRIYGEKIAEIVLSEYPDVCEVTVEIQGENVSEMRSFDAFSLELHRKRYRPLVNYGSF